MKKTTKKHYIIECRDRKLKKVTFKAFGKMELKKVIHDLQLNKYLGVTIYESENDQEDNG